MTKKNVTEKQAIMIFCWIGGMIFLLSLSFLPSIPGIIKTEFWWVLLFILPILVWMNLSIFKTLKSYWMKYALTKDEVKEK